MKNIYKNSKNAAEKYGEPGNILMGANIAGFEKVARLCQLKEQYNL